MNALPPEEPEPMGMRASDRSGTQDQYRVPVADTPYRKITADEASARGCNGFARKDLDDVWRRYCVAEALFWDDPVLNELVNRFAYHPPMEQETIQAHERTRELHLELAEKLWSYLPPGRERAVVITKLEEAMMWANAAIARNPLPPAEGQDQLKVDA